MVFDVAEPDRTGHFVQIHVQRSVFLNTIERNERATLQFVGYFISEVTALTGKIHKPVVELPVGVAGFGKRGLGFWTGVDNRHDFFVPLRCLCWVLQIKFLPSNTGRHGALTSNHGREVILQDLLIQTGRFQLLRCLHQINAGFTLISKLHTLWRLLFLKSQRSMGKRQPCVLVVLLTIAYGVLHVASLHITNQSFGLTFLDYKVGRCVLVN